MKKVVTLFIAGLSTVTLLAGCAQKNNGGFTPVTKGKFTVAMSTDFAPFEFVDLTKTGQDKYVGSDVELAKYLAKNMDLELEIKAMDFDVTLTSLDNKTVDAAISGFSYTEERAAAYAYSNCYYSEGDGGQVIVIKKENATKYTTLESMNNSKVKIAAQNGALQQELVTKQTPNATLVKIDDLNSAYDKLSSGAIEGVAVAQSVAETLVAKYPDKYVVMAQPFVYAENGNYVLVKKDNVELVKELNTHIDALGENQYQLWKEAADTLFANLGENAGEIIPEE